MYPVTIKHVHNQVFLARMPNISGASTPRRAGRRHCPAPALPQGQDLSLARVGAGLRTRWGSAGWILQGTWSCAYQ